MGHVKAQRIAAKVNPFLDVDVEASRNLAQCPPMPQDASRLHAQSASPGPHGSARMSYAVRLVDVPRSRARRQSSRVRAQSNPCL
jgi:hypothetical protein